MVNFCHNIYSSFSNLPARRKALKGLPVSDELSTHNGLSMQKAVQHFEAKRYGAAIVHFNFFKELPALTKEIAVNTATACWHAGVISRDYYKQLEASLRDLHEGLKVAQKWHLTALEAKIDLDLKKTTTLLAKTPRRRKK